MMKLAVITTTVDTPETAARLAHDLVAHRLAACVQRENVESTYHWQGKLEQAHEIRLQIKTASEKKDGVVAFIEREHPYDTPEIMVTYADVSDAYGGWVETLFEASS